MTVLLFEVLLKSDGSTTVGALCADLAGASGAAEGLALDGVCGGLPALVRHGIVQLNETR